MSEHDKPTGKRTDEPMDKANAAAPAKTAEATSDEPFLQRWSRLKSDEAAGETEGSETAESGEAETALADTEAGTPAIDPADLPDIESLDKDSDYSVFMQEGVPDALRSLALRKLFQSNPIFSVLDGLNDYDEDYSMIGIVAQKVTTAYKAGRGFLEDSDLVKIDDPADAAHADVGDADDDDDVGDGDIDDGEAEALSVDADSDNNAHEPIPLAANDDGDEPVVATLSQDPAELEPAKSEVAATASSVRKPGEDDKTDV